MKASELVAALQAKIEEHGDLPVGCYDGQPLFQALVGSVDFFAHAGMDGDLPNPHFLISSKA